MTGIYIRLPAATSAASSSSSSGADHDASACLSDLVQAFLETDTTTTSVAGDDASVAAGDDSDDGNDLGRAAAAAASMRELLDPTAQADQFRIRLAATAAAAAAAEAALRSQLSAAAFRRAVMWRLRAAGYDAGVCKARWESSGGITGGSHEYVDVVKPAEESRNGFGAKATKRYIVDTDFKAGLEVARATDEYNTIVEAVPAIVVARDEAVGRAVRLAAEAARRSLRKQGLHVPPWRKARYMLAKWLGPYKRTTNPLPAAAAAAGGAAWGIASGTTEVKCRSVGFLAPPPAPATRFWLAPAAAKIR